MAEAGVLFSNYFSEGTIPADNVLRANERAGPEGDSKVLVACGVPPGVWESRFADIDYRDFAFSGRAIPRLEMDFDSNCLYVHNVPGATHQRVLTEMIIQLGSALRGGGISRRNAGITSKEFAQYGNIIMQPDIIILGPRGRPGIPSVTIAVIDIEVSHRSTRASRRHVENIFQNPNVTLVAELKIHARRVDDSFTATLVAWVNPPGAPHNMIEVHCLNDFGTSAMIRQDENSWREDMSNDGAPNTAVPQGAGFITPPNRDHQAPREDARLDARDILRTNGNDNTLHEEVECAVGRDPNFFRIDLSPILEIAHFTLPVPLNDDEVDHDEEEDPPN